VGRPGDGACGDPRRRRDHPCRRHPVRPPVREPAQPGRAVDRAPRVEARTRGRRRPALVRLPDAAALRQCPLSGLAERAVVSDRADRGRRPRDVGDRSFLVARPPCIRDDCRRSRHGGGCRRLHDPRRVFTRRC